MTFVHGKDTVVTVGNDDLSAFTNTSEFTRSVDSHDVTTYGNDAHKYQGGLTDGGFTMGGTFDNHESNSPRAVLGPLAGSGEIVEVVRQPEGTGAGLPQDVFDALLTSYVETNPVADMVAWTAEFQVSGDVDDEVQSS